MTKHATPDYDINEWIAKRWSPYGFDGRPVPADDLRSLFEAARWAASSYNEQPWSYVIATQDNPEDFERLLSCLVEGNQGWAKHAPVLACTSLQFARNGKSNTAAIHDLGLAAGNLSIEAAARGLSVHQMIGIEPGKARELFDVPDGVDPVTGLAIGYASDPDSLPDSLKQRDSAPRQRKPISEFVYSGKWGTPADLVK